MKTKFVGVKVKPAGVKMRRILLPVDFSESEQGALNYALGLAKLMRGKIVLLHVIERAYAGPEPGMVYIPVSTTAQEELGRERMRGIARKYIPAALFDKAILKLGNPYFEITAAAKELKSDLIVISTHGRTGLSHVLMGSTAERVVRHAPCPVLTVRISAAPVAGPGGVKSHHGGHHRRSSGAALRRRALKPGPPTRQRASLGEAND